LFAAAAQVRAPATGQERATAAPHLVGVAAKKQNRRQSRAICSNQSRLQAGNGRQEAEAGGRMPALL